MNPYFAEPFVPVKSLYGTSPMWDLAKYRDRWSQGPYSLATMKMGPSPQMLTFGYGSCGCNGFNTLNTAETYCANASSSGTAKCSDQFAFGTCR